MDKHPDVALQRDYYAQTAHLYDAMHLAPNDEHQFALASLTGLVDLLGIKSVLDLGAGTGRALIYLKARHPDLRVLGVEPVAELREMGYAKGLTREELVDG